MITTTQVKSAILIILSDKAKYSTSLNYAVNYCRHALQIATATDLSTQCNYILGNIAGWRHPSAKSVRSTLKQYVKENNYES